MILDLTKWALKFGVETPKRMSTGIAAGALLGTDEYGAPAFLPRPSREAASHALVLAGSGAGKTVLMAAALLDEYLASVQSQGTNSESLVVVDAKGDLIAALLAGLCAKAPACLKQVAYLNPFSTDAFAFNLNRLPLGSTPLDIRAGQLAQLVAQVSTATGAQRHLGAGARQLDVLQHVLLGVLSADHTAANPTWALDALSTSNGLARLAKLATHPRAKAFLANTSLNEELRTSCASRIRAAFASCAQLERVMAAPSCVDLRALTGAGRLLLIDLGSPVGGVEALTVFWANLLVRLLVEQLLDRPSPWPGHHTRLVVDEAQITASVLADLAERVLCTGRSRGVSLTLLSQTTTLLHAASDSLLRVLQANTPTKIVGRLSYADADLFAKEQAPRLGVEESHSALRQRFTSTICNLADRQFFLLQPSGRARFTSRPVDLSSWSAARDRHSQAADAAMRRFGLPANASPSLTLEQAAGVSDSRTRQRTPSAPRATHSPWG